MPAYAAERPKPVTSLLEQRHDHVVVQQWDLSCGAAALATVLTYQHGDAVSERQIAQAMLRRTDPLRVKVRGGFSLLDLKRFVETRGLKGAGYTRLTFEQLTGFGPAIVPVNLVGYLHFVVFKGVEGDRVLLADPAYGNRSLSIDRFEQAWVQRIAFVVTRPHGTAPAAAGLTPRVDDVPRPTDDAVRAAIR